MASLADFLLPASNPNDPNAILGPDEVARRQLLADAMTKQGADYSPIGSPWQGAARLSDALMGVLGTKRNESMTAQGRKHFADQTNGLGPMLANMLNGGQPAAPQGTAQPASYTSPQGGGDMKQYQDAIAKNESGGNYQALGPMTHGDRAYGKYQVMGSNIPEWTAKALGHALTPEQFMSDPQAQDATFNSQFGGYLKNHSPQDAASMWFTGRPLAQGGNAQDVLGTTGNQYAQKFMAGLGAPQAPQAMQPPMQQQGAPNIAPAGVDMTQMQPIPAAMGPQPASQAPQGIQQDIANIAPASATAPPTPMAQPNNSDQAQLMQKLQSIITDPYATPQQQQVYGSMLQHLMTQADPSNQLDMKYKQAQLDQILHPQAKPAEPFTLGAGDVRYDGAGHKLAEGNAKAESVPSAVQEYQFAQGQGFKGTFQDWEASKKGGMSLTVDPKTGEVSFQQGGNIKPMTEAQSKDTVFATKARGALSTLEPNANALTEASSNALGEIPMVGNAMKSDKYQQAEQAGNEFLLAILRKESGAAIGKEELQNYGNFFLPRFGDGEAVLQQKKASRERAVKSIEAGMTPQAILASERALQSTPETAPIADATPQSADAPPLPNAKKAPDGKWYIHDMNRPGKYLQVKP
jgi:hypothetical protein